MRNIILMIALLLSGLTYSQNNFSLAVTQDAKLALVTDDYGNSPFTLDAIIKLQVCRYNIIGYVQHERAELSGGLYQRTALGLGYQIRFPHFTITPSINSGRIYRFKKGTYGLEFQTEFAYIISRHFQLTFLYNYTDRTDIGVERSNSGIGLKYTLWRMQ